MKKKVPGIIIAVAVLHFVGGGLGLLGGLCGLAAGAMGGSTAFTPGGNTQQAQQQKHMQEKQEEAIENRLPYHKVVGFVENSIATVIAILMIVAGIGLLMLKPWARKLSILYACLAIPNRILIIVIGILTVLGISDAMGQLAKEDANLAAGGSCIQDAMKVGGGIGVAISAIFIIYPIFVLIVMTRPSIAAAFATGGWVPDENEDEGWGERRTDWPAERDDPLRSDEPEEGFRAGGPQDR